MSEYLPLLVSFMIYLTGLVLFGLYFYNQNKNMSDYFLGGRSLGPMVTALSAGASDMSSWLLLGLPGLMYSTGFISIWICIGLLIGSFFNWTIVAYRLRIFTLAIDDAITLPEYLAKRFEDHKRGSILRVASSLVILIFFTLYVSAGFVGGAKLFEGTFDISYEVGLAIGAFVIIFYTFLGGYFAVSWTDVVQGLLICGALVVFPIVMLYEMNGIGHILDVIMQVRPEHYNMFNISFIAILSSLSWGLGYFGQPHIITRFMSIGDSGKLKTARTIAMVWMIIILIGSLSSAFFGIAYIEENKENIELILEDPEHILIFLNRVILNPWIGGIIISAILAAIMSTVDSQLLVSASSVTNDLYGFFAKKEVTTETSLWLSRLSVLAVAIVACILAINPKSQVLGIVAYAWAGFGASFGPAILFSLFWKHSTHLGVFVGMVLGAATVIVWETLDSYDLHTIFDLYEIVPGFFLASLSIFLISLCDKNKVDEKIWKKAFEKL